jgi:hypothetical protein
LVRIAAQSVIPGILHGDQSATLLHGATERRQAFKVNADFQARRAGWSDGGRGGDKKQRQ